MNGQFYGKIKSIQRDFNSGKANLYFNYDANGNRISKTTVWQAGIPTITYYVRDAAGNVMSTYKITGPSLEEQSISLQEQSIYGSSRVGVKNRNLNLTTPPALINPYFRMLGEKQFELSNHLGNVLSTVKDTRIARSVSGSTTDYYEANLQSAQDYYAFGALMQGRGKNGNYRYGFNGKENDNEVKGEGNELDFGARIYDSRLGRWLSIDPLQKKYPSFSPYNSMANNPILFKDKDGREPTIANTIGLTQYLTLLRNISSIDGLARIYSADWSPTDPVFEARYLYSPKWGWVDMRHFAAAAWKTDIVIYTATGTLENGENTENDQYNRGDASGFDYEDLVSNLLGTYFETYLESDEAKGKSFQTNLANYLTQLGFVDNPLEEAPNADKLPANHDGATNDKNYGYTTKYATKKKDGVLDKKIIDFLIKYLDGAKVDDRRNEESKKKDAKTQAKKEEQQNN